MKERNKIHFFDTSSLVETEGIRERCTVDYINGELQKRLPGEKFKVASVNINESGEYQKKTHWLIKLLWNSGKIEGLPPYVEVVIEHCTGNEWENIIVWSPLQWNDRFAGTCGGGTCTGGESQINAPNNGQRGLTLPFAIVNGFTAATSDAGNEKYGSDWASDENGKLIPERVENWRTNATHNMTVFGKAIAEILHQRAVKYSYLNGGSGGGRQSMVEVQEHPEEYDGVWVSSPAINWTKFLISGFWPMAVANEYGAPLKYHKMNAFAKAVHESVGGSDKYYKLTERVEFDPYTLVGTKTKQGVITEADAKVIDEIWQGPRRKNGERLWHFFRPGLIHWRTGLPVFATSFILPFMKARPFYLCSIFARWSLEDKKATFDDINIEKFEELYDAAMTKFRSACADSPDLSEFEARGGKLMIDHGIDDPLIPVEVTMNYHQRIKSFMGKERTDAFCRVFLAPGDNHGNCHGNGPGITESDGMRALMDWVENGNAPTTLRTVRINQKTGEAMEESTVSCAD